MEEGAATLAFGQPILVPSRDKNALDLIEMYAAIVDAKSGTSVLRALATAAPLRSMSHAKRVRKNADDPSKIHILLCPVHAIDTTDDIDMHSNGHAINTGADNADNDSPWVPPSMLLAANPPTLDALPDRIAGILRGKCDQIFVAHVSRYAPHSKEDQIAWGAHWPVSLRAPHRQDLKERVEVSEEDTGRMRRHMASAMRLALDNRLGGRRRNAVCNNACVIVDSERDCIVAGGVDETDVHPLRHAVMVAVDRVAQWQLKMWPPGKTTNKNDSGCNMSEGVPGQVKEESGGGGKRQRVEAAQQTGDLLPMVTEEVRVEEGEHFIDPGERPYLCTGYDAYIVQEPCAMCAMALVHSRLRRVVFCKPNSCGGMLGGSGWKLHSKPTLNHHYTVYHLPQIHL